jgi:hypothetical protein
VDISRKYKELGKKFFIAGKTNNPRILNQIHFLLDEMYDLEYEFWTQIKSYVSTNFAMVID